ncbi:DUF5677 domain-containing protein [Burkholderia sp. LMG 32019]|uniref:DUF5677 domain-containing protein n=1 Tax=Burkholderia sp. LMG 32019 TaxID=3158173 RepID=UPI003C2F445A
MANASAGQALPEVKRVEVTPESLSKLSDEQDFVGLSVELMIECGSWTCIAASLLPGETGKWSRDQAILGGLIVRAYKLMSSLLDQTCQHRRETTFILGRLLFESLINVQYLVAEDSAELYQAFVINSLKHEKRLKERIESNINERSGLMLPIEGRMLDSIKRAFDTSGVKPDEVTKQAAKPWSDVDLFQRSSSVGWGDSYLAMFGGLSHNVHGSWHDLLEYHLLDDDEGGFSPELTWHMPKPQLLLALVKVSLVTLSAYLEHLVGDSADGVIDALDDLWGRIEVVDRAHEDFLSRAQG